MGNVFLFDMIEPEHKVSNIGTYNRQVTDCVFCQHRDLDIFGSDCVGFSEAPYGTHRNKELAVVYRCPECQELQWSHCGMPGYRLFQRWEHRQKMDALSKNFGFSNIQVLPGSDRP